MNILSFFVRHSRRTVVLSVIAGIFSGACNAALLGVINSVVKRNGPTPALVWAFVGLCALLPLARFISEFLLAKLGQGATYMLRMQLCGQILRAPLRHLEEIGIPRLLTTLTDDIPAVTGAVSVIPIVTVNTALVIGCLVYMGILSWLLLGIVLVFMAIGIVTYQLPIIKVQSIFGLARKDADALQKHFHALTHGAKELKIHGGRREAFLRESLQATAASLQRYNTAGLNLYSAASSWGQTLVFVVVGLVLLLLPTMRALNVGTLTGYTITLLYLMTPLQVVMNMLPQLTRANVALKKVKELGFTLESMEAEETVTAVPPVKPWGKLELESVTHRYKREGEADAFVLGPINLTLNQGEMVFVVGGNGSGKTTLVKLLTGLYAPESGAIFLDGLPIGAANKETYRQYFSVVFSDFYLFDQMLGLIGPALDEEAREYLKQLKLSHKVEIKDGRLSTTDLSQGQRKRLALLTAYLEDRPICIFDEWAADQDPQFKNLFYMKLLPELKAKGKTVIVISHDDRYYQVADRIIKLDDGQVVSDSRSTPEQPVLKAANARVMS
ncbi:MAG: cyclic peptide export ABC transporter [Candidatus Angelobacter sp.]